jgi:hypothetical protein
MALLPLMDAITDPLVVRRAAVQSSGVLDERALPPPGLCGSRGSVGRGEAGHGTGHCGRQ